MPKRGICKLCLNTGDLQDSHMIPKALYKMAREPGFDPVVMTQDISLHTSRQVSDHLLCWDCEQRLSEQGEKYVMGLVHNGKRFPLLDRLEFVRIPIVMERGVVRYATVGTEINTRRMAYFALSVMWRAAVHHWPLIGAQTTSFELPDAERESIRKFLLGGGIPSTAYVLVGVCKDEVSQGHVMSPFRMATEANDVTHILLARGIYFRVMFDGSRHSKFEELCSVRSSGRFIFVEDSRRETIDALRKLNENARIATNLKRKKRRES